MMLNRKLSLLTATLMLGVAGCASAPEPSEQLAQVEYIQDVAKDLSQTRTTVSSENGNLICKRQAIVGSKFKRKICGTPEDWEAASAKSRPVIDRFQRAKAPGTSN